jgi:hypothetical protein
MVGWDSFFTQGMYNVRRWACPCFLCNGFYIFEFLYLHMMVVRIIKVEMVE